MRIGLCVKHYQRILDLLRAALPQDEIFDCAPTEIAEAAQNADVLIPLVNKVPVAAFNSPRLKLIQQFGVGLDVVDIPAATAAGVRVANVPSVGSGNAESVAELAIAHLLMLARQLPLALQRFRERKLGAPMGDALWQSTVLILGYGGIGEEIARRLTGFGCRVIAVSRHGPDGARARDPQVPLARHVAMSGLSEVIAKADHIVVAAPATPENLGLVDAAMIAQMKPGVRLVNIARGQVIDYHALLAGLRSGQIAGAGLDVFANEPHVHPGYRALDNVFLSPHIGSATTETRDAMGLLLIDGIEMLAAGRVPANLLP
jgi:lactate dehydrogenase-like 2-hydroxyacid dehydrogenase